MFSNIRFNLAMIMLGLLAGLLIGYQQVAGLFSLRPISDATSFSAIEQANPPRQEVTKIEGRPVRLVIPSIGIDLSIGDGYYDESSKSWTLSDTQAMYATMTPPANNIGGNTFIYGHNIASVFEDLSDLEVGEKAIIYTDNNHQFVYQFEHSIETTPNDSSLFSYRGGPILTLQTCSGIWSQNRYLLTLKLIEYS